MREEKRRNRDKRASHKKKEQETERSGINPVRDFATNVQERQYKAKLTKQWVYVQTKETGGRKVRHLNSIFSIGWQSANMQHFSGN